MSKFLYSIRQVRDVRRPQIWKFIGVVTISDIIELLEWRQRMVHRVFG